MKIYWNIRKFKSRSFGSQHSIENRFVFQQIQSESLFGAFVTSQRSFRRYEFFQVNLLINTVLTAWGAYCLSQLRVKVPREILSNVGYIGMGGSKGYGFQQLYWPFSFSNRAWFGTLVLN